MKGDYDPALVRSLAASRRDAAAEALSALVRVPGFSGSEGERVALLKDLCEEAGMEGLRVDALGSLLGTVGRGKRMLAFDAHIDTVGPGDPAAWDTPPHSGLLRGGLVLGRGSADQLGGAAAMIQAASVLKELAWDGGFTILFSFTVLEEDCDGLCWDRLIEVDRVVPDFFVSTEPTSCRLYRGHRGRMEIRVDFRGVSCHGSAPERGKNAAYAASRAALAVAALNARLKADDDGFLGKGTVVVSRMEAAGPSQCAVPDSAWIYLDRRLTWGEDKAIALAQVEAAIKDAGVDDFSISVPCYSGRAYTGASYPGELYFPTWKLPADHELVRAGVGAHRDLFGSPPVVDKWTFSTNCVAVAGRRGIPCVGFGPGDEAAAHAPNESNRVDDLEKCVAFYAALPYVLEGCAAEGPSA